MAATRFYLKTWYCATCGYKQDGDPNDETYVATHFWNNPNIADRYGEDVATTLPLGVCPGCFYSKGVSVDLPMTTDATKMITVDTMDPNLVSTLQTIDRDASGQPIMVDSGNYNIQVVGLDANNQPIYEKDPIMVPQMRSLTAAEQSAVNQQIQDDLSRFSAICYSQESI